MNEVTREFLGQRLNLTDLVADVVAAYVSNNHVAAGELPTVIATVYAALVGLASGQSMASVEELIERPNAAQIRKSIRPDAIVSFIDGKGYKTLKRHLTSHGLDPRTYRERYGLPEDYPMVSPNYAAQRSALAKSIGLGVPGAQAAQEQKGRKAA